MIPLVDLRAQYYAIKREIHEAIDEVLESGQFALGPPVTAFEEAFASYCGTAEAVGVNSGTSALHLALLAAGVGPGDEVITVPFTFVASIAAIEYAGARPVFVDVDPDHYTMDPARLQAAMSPRTKAIMPVHLYGQPADMDPILEIAGRRGIPVIEDACQAHGAEYHGRRCGSIGRLGCFSFYPGKNLGAYGEGGAVVTNDAALASRVRLLRAWGEETRYQHDYRGFNYRMDGIQGAVLGVKLRHLEQWTEARRSHAATTGACSTGPPPWRRVFVPTCGTSSTCTSCDSPPRREIWRAKLAEAGVQTGVHYPIPLHLQPAYRDLGTWRATFPSPSGWPGRFSRCRCFPR